MKNIFCMLLSILLSSIVFGEPMKSSIGSQHMKLQYPKSELTAASYVQDGLVALYDGIENAGWGVHDPNVIEWLDLTGNGHTLTGIWNTVVWEDKCLYSCHGCIFSEDAGFAIAGNMNDRTIELVSSGSATGAYRCHIQTMWFDTSPHGLDHNFWKEEIFIKCGTSFASPEFTTQGIQGTPNSIFAKTVRLCGDECILTINSNMSVKGTRSKSYSSFRYLALGNSRGTSRNTDARIYCCRIYDRVLSDAEVAYNYQIDKARFGL